MDHPRFPPRRGALLALLALAVPGWSSPGAEVYVVANRPLSLSAEDLKEIFLGEVQFVGGARVAPVDTGSAQALFLERVLKMSAARYSSWWTKKSFRDGQNPPPSRATDAQVLAFVKETPGAIGYVGAPPEGVHLVGRF
jgi:ABC-type phosphate transport system substrate-binding protein